MKNAKRPMLALLASACILTALRPGATVADSVSFRRYERLQPVYSITQNSGVLLQEQENETLKQQIRTAYRAAKKKARIKSFKGKCGRYVNLQLVILGINQRYIGCNGNREYDAYCKKSASSGGYAIRAYSAKKYSLKQALEAIAKENPNARNILIGFQKGTSKAGKKYGHTLFIHGIENGMVYFSDSFSQKVNGVRYKEGEPIVCSIERFAKLYQKYKLDGVIWFT